MAKEYFVKEGDVDVLKDDVDKKISSPNTAGVGQILSVKAIDENGKPTAWEVIDKPESSSLGNIKIYNGSIRNIEVSPYNLYTTSVKITFPDDGFITVPDVVATVYETSTDDKVTFTVTITNITNTYCYARISCVSTRTNTSADSVYKSLKWIAIGE